MEILSEKLQAIIDGIMEAAQVVVSEHLAGALRPMWVAPSAVEIININCYDMAKRVAMVVTAPRMEWRPGEGYTFSKKPEIRGWVALNHPLPNVEWWYSVDTGGVEFTPILHDLTFGQMPGRGIPDNWYLGGNLEFREQLEKTVRCYFRPDEQIVRVLTDRDGQAEWAWCFESEAAEYEFCGQQHIWEHQQNLREQREFEELLAQMREDDSSPQEAEERPTPEELAAVAEANERLECLLPG